MRFKTAFLPVVASATVLVAGLIASPAISAAATPSPQNKTGSTEEVNPRFYFELQPSGCRLELNWGTRVNGPLTTYWLAELYASADSARPSRNLRSYGRVVEGDYPFDSSGVGDRGRVWAEGSVGSTLASHYYTAFGWAHSCPGESSRVLATVQLEHYRSYPKTFPVTLTYKGTITAGPDADVPLYRWLRHTGGDFGDPGNYAKGDWKRAAFSGSDRSLTVTDSERLADAGDVYFSGRMLEVDLDGDKATTDDRVTTGWIHAYV